MALAAQTRSWNTEVFVGRARWRMCHCLEVAMCLKTVGKKKEQLVKLILWNSLKNSGKTSVSKLELNY